MTTSESNGIPAVMNVAPTGYGGYGMPYGGINNGFGGDWAWILLLLLIGGNGWGGWGMGGFGGMMGMGMMDGGFGLYPWLNQANQISDGFQNQSLNTTVNGIADRVTSGFGDVQNSLCAGFAGVNASVNNAQNALAQQMYTNQISDLERSFAAQTATTQGMNAIGQNLQTCCCENRAGIESLRYTVATENCADRTAAAQNTRDIIDAQTRGTQAILDKLCALELDGVKGQLAAAQRENVGLQNQLNMATMRESQTAQNAFIAQGLSNEVDALYNRLSNCPVPTVPVYGRQPIFSCGGNNCGCNNGFATS